MTDLSYEDVLAFFSTGRNIKGFIKHADNAFLIELQSRLGEALTTRQEELKREQEAQRIRDQKRNELLALIISEGFTPEELIPTDPLKNKVRRQMKYQYSENGQIKKWSGVGRTPRPIKDALSHGGKTLDDFSISIETK
jgi:DNA-binding protein H-NS